MRPLWIWLCIILYLHPSLSLSLFLSSLSLSILTNTSHLYTPKLHYWFCHRNYKSCGCALARAFSNFNAIGRMGPSSFGGFRIPSRYIYAETKDFIDRDVTEKVGHIFKRINKRYAIGFAGPNISDIWGGTGSIKTFTNIVRRTREWKTTRIRNTPPSDV